MKNNKLRPLEGVEYEISRRQPKIGIALGYLGYDGIVMAYAWPKNRTNESINSFIDSIGGNLERYLVRIKIKGNKISFCEGENIELIVAKSKEDSGKIIDIKRVINEVGLKVNSLSKIPILSVW